jgi:hypothetical protein
MGYSCIISPYCRDVATSTSDMTVGHHMSINYVVVLSGDHGALD